jgi:enamine deaminase RidA (YjgF/YER057c/UK114 family)
MAAHSICKTSQAGIGYSVVELNDVRHVFAAAVPRGGATLRQQADDALRTIEAAIRDEGARNSVVHQAVFVADVSLIDECRQIIREFYGPELPVTSYIPQRPCDGNLLSIEALGIGRGKGNFEIERVSEQLVVARHNGIAWIHAACNATHPSHDGVYSQTNDAFQSLEKLLISQNVHFDQVIRTWLYLGGIVENDGPIQRYKELNRARSDFYRDISFIPDRLPDAFHGAAYPASTGIGIEGCGISLSAIAISTDRKDIIAVPLENPRQKAAYEYSAGYSPDSPKFSRALALSCGTYTTIFISGTASITDSETRHIGDVAAQTNETLDNIAALIDERNLARHGLPGLGTSLDGIGIVRVYVKRQEDYPLVRQVCENRLGELPIIYAIADVCRPELLVEIEGIAFSAKS